ncbi:recombinase family protein [Cytobacillus sp. NCCP-133]|uniref:recombinase family protein n=1 Tax=Cytobacillus sp. NCCP-133 TaxID=766848 RepID=UPI002230C4C4|nr:recombinase family protein [Cytobacillus sp. NCCP-133]
MEKKGAYFCSINEGIDTSRSLKISFKDIVANIADFESDMLSEKTKEGINEAKQQGTLPGRPRIPDTNIKKAISMYQSRKYSLAEIKTETGISKSTLYRYLGK